MNGDGQRAIARLLYRGFMLAAKRLGKQVARHRTSDIFSQAESKLLSENFPGIFSAMSHGEHAIKAFVKLEFFETEHDAASKRAEHKDPSRQKIERTSMGFMTLRLINDRMAKLEQHAVENISDKVTNGVRVVIESGPSSRLVGQYLCGYKVTIKNESCREPVQLVSRSWTIIDAEGNVQTVSGPGVLGKHPLVDIGSEFVYESLLPLNSKRGTLKGTYYMLGMSTGELFDVNVGPLAFYPQGPEHKGYAGLGGTMAYKGSR